MKRGARHTTHTPGNYRRGERTGPARNEIAAAKRAREIEDLRNCGLTFWEIDTALGCSANAAWLVVYRQKKKGLGPWSAGAGARALQGEADGRTQNSPVSTRTPAGPTRSGATGSETT